MADAAMAQPAACDAPARVAAVKLALTAFRNYPTLRLDIEPASCVLTGPNGAGKTNLLEALSLLAPGRGLRRAPLRELGRTGDGPFAVHGTFLAPDGVVEVGTGLDPETERRVVHVDGVARSGPAALADVTGAVWLTPAMDRLFVDGTSSRRRLLDRLVQAGDPAYARQLALYDHCVRERARLLRDGRADPVWLAGLEQRAAAAGVAVAAARLEVTAELNARLAEGHSPFPVAALAVRGEVEREVAERPALEAEDRFARRLAASREDDAATGGARHGPHRSDLDITDVELAAAAGQVSTGRQKALLVGLVLAECRLFRDRTGRLPLLLLDEVGAHLDRRRRGELTRELHALGAQAWLTGTEPDGFEELRGHAQFLRVDQARVLRDVRD
jgi:DNA replication and repair protein RecF